MNRSWRREEEVQGGDRLLTGWERIDTPTGCRWVSPIRDVMTGEVVVDDNLPLLNSPGLDAYCRGDASTFGL